MWTILRVAAGVALLGLYAWFLSRPVPVAGPDDHPWRRIARSAGMTLVVAIGLPLAGLTLLFGASLWKVLLAGWVWVLGGAALGFAAAFIWEKGTAHLRPEVREPAGRVIFWTFFVLGGLGLVLLAVRWLGGRPA
jgi:hypothetical protein